MKEIKESTQKEREQKKQRTRQLEHTYTHEKWGKKWPLDLDRSRGFYRESLGEEKL